MLGWDEAFLGVTVDDPFAFARSVQDAVLTETRLSCSVGIGDTKVRAKIATDFGKPQGQFTLTRDNWFEVMGDRPTAEVYLNSGSPALRACAQRWAAGYGFTIVDGRGDREVELQS